MQSARKPAWLNKKISLSDCQPVKELLRDFGLQTVCQQAACPNIGECFRHRQATFLILGTICTRNCRFCAVRPGTPGPVDPQEPDRVAGAVQRLGLRHVVVTSVTRDDLADGGAGMFAGTIDCIRQRNPATTIEVLIPDFQLDREALRRVTAARPDIIAHNLETVPRLYPLVRSQADYRRSLEVLALLKTLAPAIAVKSGLMLGLGETQEEVLTVFQDLARIGCDFLSVGQYLAPGKEHFPVQEYILPEQFEWYGRKALQAGLRRVASGPYVRSSYLAHRYLEAEAV
ncbi:MAG TPA: lipoyl synthase [Candidatus Omnitrophota bacterium]|nr:lipoyl synthase [Candidatus Omnitrophota bacterium]HRZ15504.1 lipoyl synthase [Candidatus Omnitrophota bacterium]